MIFLVINTCEVPVIEWKEKDKSDTLNIIEKLHKFDKEHGANTKFN